MKSITRAALYTRVWNTPLTALAKEWSTSAEKLSALCDKFSVARPPSGYWTRKQMGKDELIPTLDERTYPADLTLEIPRVKKRLTAEAQPRSSIHIPAKVARYDPAISRALKQYTSTTYRREPFLFAIVDSQTAALSVSRDSFKRAARILDFIYKYAHKKGWPIESGKQGDVQVNVVEIEGERVMFRIRERLTRSMRELSAQEQAAKAAGRWVDQGLVYLPTGRLLLSIEGWGFSGRTLWEDKPTRALEEWVEEFLIGLEEKAADQRNRRELRESGEKRRAHHEKVMRGVRQQIKAWSDRKELLLNQFEQWQRAQECRRFISAVEEMMHRERPPSAAQEEWLAWARRIADSIDPVKTLVESDFADWDDSNALGQALRDLAEFDSIALSRFEKERELDWFEHHLNL